MIPLELVVAADRRLGIGKGGELPWRLPGELRHFRKLTLRTGDPEARNAVIMGRKTWDSLPARFRPLPGRLNVVLTRTPDLRLPDAVTADDLPGALALIEAEAEPPVERAFVIGGAEVFAAGLRHPDCRRLHITRVDADFDCDTFVDLDLTPYRRVAWSEPMCESCPGPHGERAVCYHFEEYVRHG